ncbi:MAG TPA: DUF2911 domain-containing protein [Ferruginibacter sp.]|nr:DUF2911 domain-containing protein [Ferruginibacter sp.]
MFRKKVYLLLFLFPLLFSCRQNEAPKKTNDVIDSLQSATINEYAPRDQSPMDMSYYPLDYPVQKMNGTDSTGPVARIIYSRPHKKGRNIFGDKPESLCQYGKEWRLGANEATELELFENVNISGKNVSRGRYIVYCIPFADKWTIIFNTNLFTWGLQRDHSKDIFKVDIPVSKQIPALEDFTMVFISTPGGADLLMAWDDVKASLPIDFSK